MKPEDIKELERQTGVNHLRYTEGHGSFECSFVVEHLAYLPEYDCECDYAAYDYEGFTCDNCLDKETKL